jgi:hypothetical protein
MFLTQEKDKNDTLLDPKTGENDRSHTCNIFSFVFDFFEAFLLSSIAYWSPKVEQEKMEKCRALERFEKSAPKSASQIF